MLWREKKDMAYVLLGGKLGFSFLVRYDILMFYFFVLMCLCTCA